MRRHFYLVMSMVLWLVMVVGFSDNWLFDVGQESNSDPTFLIHAFFAFSWFSLVVIQASLIRMRRLAVHMTLGLAGIAAYSGFFLVTSYIYISRALTEGAMTRLGVLNVALFAFATVLIVNAFLVRHRDSQLHKTNIIIGTFLVMEPGISRALGHLFSELQDALWLLAYLVLFGTFVWYYRKVNWQIAIGFLIWLTGTANIVVGMAQRS
jgi:hypothetical protein